MTKYPMADAKFREDQKEKSLKAIEERRLVGAANNAKWNKLITHMRERGQSKENWLPSYRWKTVEEYISGWDVEWWYHLPFPFVGVEWFDIGLHELVPVGRLAPDKTIDHSDWIIPLLEDIRFEHEKAGDTVRIWGYLPKSYEDFPPSD